MRVAQFLTEQHIAFEAVLHPPAFCAQKRAKYLRLPGKQVTKAVLLAGPEDYFLAVLPATDRMDEAALAAALGGPVRVADRDEVARVFADCEWGVVVPFGSLYGLPVVLEAGIDPDAVLVFEGHTHAEAFRLRCREFERLEHPARLPFRSAFRAHSHKRASP
jgi:Ala-tRNA(Pro) deacylase